MANDPYEQLTIGEAVRHVRDAEKNINAIIRQLCERTGLRIEVEATRPDFGPPSIILNARAK